MRQLQSENGMVFKLYNTALRVRPAESGLRLNQQHTHTLFTGVFQSVFFFHFISMLNPF